MRWVYVIYAFFARIFSSETVRNIIRGIRATEPYLPTIYQWVRMVAEMTPTRADDEMLRVADMFGVPLLLAPDADRGAVLADIILQAARRKWPEATDRAIRRAIEIAYGALRP